MITYVLVCWESNVNQAKSTLQTKRENTEEGEEILRLIEHTYPHAAEEQYAAEGIEQLME